MIKVMVIDDEPLAREYIVKLVDWQRLGMEVCCEAGDGEEGKALIASMKPDIVLMDVVMPFADGLSVVEWMKALNIYARVIVISGNDDYGYLRKSVKLDVVDYLLKPFDIEELESILEKQKPEIVRHNEMVKQEEKNVVYNGLFNPTKEHLQALTKLYSDKGYTDCRVTLAYSESTELRNHILKKFEAMASLAGYVLKLGQNRFVIFEYSASGTWEHSMMEDFRSEYEDGDYYLNQLIVGQSEVFSISADLQEGFRQASSVVNMHILYAEKGVFTYEASPNEYDERYSSDILGEAIEAVRRGDQIAFTEIIESLIARFRQERMSYRSVIKVMETFIGLLEGLNVQRELKEKIVNDYKDAISERSLDHIEAYTLTLVEEVFRGKQEEKVTKSKMIALDIQGMIDAEYGELEMSGDYISQKLFLEKSYLRRVFKQETGKTMNQYIINKRMQHAKELLLKNSLVHSEIALRCGYGDPAYFSKSFKKYVGMTPKEYELTHL